ncbi:TAXI family TRAP transporter solute-binding subunit [Streptomyces sp. PTM05]|uniref:TAXI family TRAP transporter solute-binding subunit n=1 Tax=Streptantibioticus parmotrematis TaxID=2873249 RepID=A0ABS7QXW1_9ACTN|nr:TAXI family TRAP transporter solute-binding subunit [Streptantibioticus parmotrematis]MBY8887190.1 TAXI family TRAP transporter solute-binding subunit [Streptantibioticus parmotrematis]
MRFSGRFTRRRAVRAGLAGAIALGLLLWWLLPTGRPAFHQSSVTVATGVKSGVYDKYGQLLGPVLAKYLPGVSVHLLPSQGSVQNIDYVASGRADFTFAQADAVADYHGPQRSRLRAVARLYDDYMQLIVPADSKVTSARDLRGLRVGMGQPGSGVNLIAQRLVRAAGLTPGKDFTAVPAGIDTAPELLEQGKLDAFFWSGGIPTGAVQELAAHYPVKLVQLGDLVQSLHKLGAAADYYRAAVMPVDAYAHLHNTEAVPTIAVANLLITTDRADAALVERVTEAVIDSRDRIGAVVHSAQQVDLRTAIYTDPLPLHEGARRYYLSVKP